jgi:hypothetical protein
MMLSFQLPSISSISIIDQAAKEKPSTREKDFGRYLKR